MYPHLGNESIHLYSQIEVINIEIIILGVLLITLKYEGYFFVKVRSAAKLEPQ